MSTSVEDRIEGLVISACIGVAVTAGLCILIAACLFCNYVMDILGEDDTHPCTPDTVPGMNAHNSRVLLIDALDNGDYGIRTASPTGQLSTRADAIDRLRASFSHDDTRIIISNSDLNILMRSDSTNARTGDTDGVDERAHEDSPRESSCGMCTDRVYPLDTDAPYRETVTSTMFTENARIQTSLPSTAIPYTTDIPSGWSSSSITSTARDDDGRNTWLSQLESVM